MKFERPLQKIVALLAGLGILFVAYFGSYRPFEKSRLFIRALTTPPPNLQDIQARFSQALDYPSPIGQEELVRNTAATLFHILQNTQDPDAIASLMRHIENYYRPIISSGRGTSFNQNLYLLGLSNEIALMKTRNPEYFVAAREYFLEGRRRSPRRPQFLLGMFDIHLFERNTKAAKAVGEEILRYWPTDKRTRRTLQAIHREEAQD